MKLHTYLEKHLQTATSALLEKHLETATSALLFRSNIYEVFCKKGALKNFA